MIAWKETLRRMDPMLLLYLLLLGILGLITLYAAVHQGDTGLWKRQCLYWLLGLVLFFGICFIPLRSVALFSWPVYIIAVISLALVPWIGEIQMGARRWLNLGLFHIQPSEIVKWALMLLLAHWFASREASSLKGLGGAVLLSSIPVVFIIMQPDLGTALVLLFAASAMLFAAGLPWRWFTYGLITALISLPVMWRNMHAYQKERILSFLNPQSDPLGAGYHVIQSTISIGSGGIFGKGYLQGTQARLHFLPEQHTDFIFAVLAEEGGLVISILLLVLYGLFLSRILTIGARASTRFSSLVCIGIATIFMLYICINIGMVSGVLPVVGVPLPFVSYGGSALITMLASLGVVMRVAIESNGRIPWQRPGNPLA
ncbi:MAG TPA: rod shape-determining protein RodA [Mariprofundaceae bacterium]|nr:rod shape-determining protein RodA [Mariprofundaceae bacterium]